MSQTPENSKVLDLAAKILESGAVKPTRQRLAIARVLFARHQHLSADQVMVSANHAGAEISKVLSIPILDDENNDADNAFKLRLCNPSDNAILGVTDESVITITDIHAPVDEAMPAAEYSTLG